MMTVMKMPLMTSSRSAVATRAGAMALLVANEYLEAQLNTLQAAIENGDVPLHSGSDRHTRLH
jgi:hypothetical protein